MESLQEVCSAVIVQPLTLLIPGATSAIGQSLCVLRSGTMSLECMAPRLHAVSGPIWAVAVVNEYRRRPRQHIVRVQVIDGEVVGAGVLREGMVRRDDDGVAVVCQQSHAWFEVARFDPGVLGW